MIDEPESVSLARHLLERRGYTVTPPLPPPPVNHCAICGITDDDNRRTYGGALIPVEVLVNYGEEGASDVTRWYCDDHIIVLGDAFRRLGLGSHHHGSTTLVEVDPEICGGYGTCTLYPDRPSSGIEEVYHDGPLDAGPA